jgi:hypothetical protein
MRRVFIDVIVKVILDMDDGCEVNDFVENMDYNLISTTEGIDVFDTEITDYNVRDSK